MEIGSIRQVHLLLKLTKYRQYCLDFDHSLAECQLGLSYLFIRGTENVPLSTDLRIYSLVLRLL